MTDLEVRDVTFHQVKYLTNAMLSHKAIKAIYEASSSVSKGVYLEIGPAQGGSTLAIALGRRSAGREAMIYTADVFMDSAALKTGDKNPQAEDVDVNVAVLKSNLAEFGVGDHVRIIVVTREDLATTVPADAEIGLFFVDADGAIDRDFAQFYDRVLPGGQIIMDDCEDRISDKYLSWSDARLQKYARKKHNYDNIADLCPFGKHYTVYRFAQTLVKLGLIEEIRTVTNTAFFRKVGLKPYAESGAPEGLAETRAAIAREFFQRRDQLTPTAASR
jgi:predicted O-methyltransferase YrrM